VDFLKKLLGVSTNTAYSGAPGSEYQENMDDAYRSRGPDPEDEARAEVIQEIFDNAKNNTEASPEDKLARLDRLKSQGIITDAEYEQLKQELDH
jgi:hypothetical protein